MNQRPLKSRPCAFRPAAFCLGEDLAARPFAQP